MVVVSHRCSRQPSGRPARPRDPAIAGGGCHSGATQGEGDTVELLDACPTPTILTIDPGGTVTFVNKDPFTHNVIGSAGAIPRT